MAIDAHNDPMTDGEADEDGQSSERLREGFDILTKHMLLGRVDVLLEATSEFAFPVVSAAYGGRPAAGSPMNADLACESADIVANVQRVCGAWSMVASEYLQAVATAHQAGRILWAPGPLRGCLEHCARIGWILDGSDARQRGARSWLAEIVASGEDARTHENLGNPAPTLHGAPRRLIRPGFDGCSSGWFSQAA